MKIFTPLAILALLSTAGYAEELVITVKDSQFSPVELTIPVNQKVKITVKNLDSKPAEFESYSLHREKIISANSDAIIFVGPVDAGEYEYFNDFNPKVKAKIIAK